MARLRPPAPRWRRVWRLPRPDRPRAVRVRARSRRAAATPRQRGVRVAALRHHGEQLARVYDVIAGISGATRSTPGAGVRDRGRRTLARTIAAQASERGATPWRIRVWRDRYGHGVGKTVVAAALAAASCIGACAPASSNPPRLASPRVSRPPTRPCCATRQERSIPSGRCVRTRLTSRSPHMIAAERDRRRDRISRARRRARSRDGRLRDGDR